MAFRRSRKLKIMLAWTVVILWMVLIFVLSAQPSEQSNQLSTSITVKTISSVKKVLPYAEINPERLHYVVRKSAHFFAYLMLGLMVSNALMISGSKRVKLFALALLFCFFYALSDEIHQSFVPGRACQLRDVLIDTLGAAVGIMFYERLFYSVFNKVLHTLDNN